MNGKRNTVMGNWVSVWPSGRAAFIAIVPRAGLRLWRLPDYRRLWLLGLWLLGAIANIIRGLELLASGFLVLDLTGSASVVALMAVSQRCRGRSRSLP
jgi:hypothetical protein